ncbi:hypothetical protein E4U41_001428, partial [Claviceps citrina]
MPPARRPLTALVVCTSLLVLVLFSRPSTADIYERPVKPAAVGLSLTPDARKAGGAGKLGWPFWKEHLGWYFDESPYPPGNDGSYDSWRNQEGPIAVPMLRGVGRESAQDLWWVFQFSKLRERTRPPPA